MLVKVNDVVSMVTGVDGEYLKVIEGAILLRIVVEWEEKFLDPFQE